MRIVLDTNILVAAVRSRTGASFRLVSMIPTARFRVALSLPLYYEYLDVLHRNDVRPVGLNDREITDFIDNILTHAETREIHFLWRHSLRDKKDDMVLELAVASQADYIVTFNIGDFANIELFGIEAIVPGEFLKRLD
jgi:putative PIN family toxin of toxin-antitoxin system